MFPDFENSSRAGNDHLVHLIAKLLQAENGTNGQSDARLDPITFNGEIKRILQQTQVALTESRERYQRLVDKMSALIFELDTEGEILFVNQYVETQLGYSPQELIGKNWWTIFYPGDHQQEACKLRNAIASKDITSHESNLRHRDGNYITFELTSANLWNEEGKHERIVGIGINVNQRKQIEKTLADERALLARIIDQAAGGIVVCDRDSRITLVNQIARKLAIKEPVGSTAEDIREVWGEPVNEFGKAHTSEEEWPLRRALNGEVIDAAEGRLIQPGGKVHDLLYTCTPIHDQDNEIIGAVATFADISDRKKMLLELRERTCLAELNAEIGSILSCSFDLQSMIVRCLNTITIRLNLTGSRFWRFDEKSLCLYSDFDSADNHCGARLGNRQLELGEGPIGQCAKNREVIFIDKTDSCGETSNQGQCKKCPNGSCCVFPLIVDDRLIGVMCACSPTTFSPFVLKALGSVAGDIAVGVDRKLKEKALEQSRQVFETFMDNNPAMTFIKDADGRHIYVNKPLRQYLATFADDSDMKNSTDLWPEEYAKPLDANDRMVLQENKVVQTIEKLPGENGTDRFFQTVKFPLSNQRQQLLGGLAIDITERLEMEESLRQTKEQLMQSQKMDAIGRLAGGVAHDFNNLLTVINGYSEMVLSTFPDNNPVRDDLMEVILASERATTLTRQLLAFSRKEYQEPKIINLNTLIQDSEKMLGRIIGEDVLLQFKGASDLKTTLLDPSHLSQIIMNLAVNARDAMPSGGCLTISTSNVELNKQFVQLHPTAQAGVFVELKIADTGCGIAPENRDRIFEPFFTTKPDDKGTGLGLSTVYGIVNQSGGFILLDSEVGKGSTFTIYFPVCDDSVANQEISKGNKIRQGKETILIVEDDPGVRNLMSSVLQKYGYKIILVEDGAEAMNSCRDENIDIDLVISDIIMPGVYGHITVQQIMEIRPGIKCLLMSGYDGETLGRLNGLKAHPFISKPFTSQLLLKKIEEVLDN